MKIRKANDRGLTHIDWLYSRHSFSFGEYYDPRNMGFRSLRVINDDIIEPGEGFGMHGHRDMEIITVVVEGALEHKDSLGHGEVLRPGEVQVMTAGRGIRHSEFNPSSRDRVHLIQIWIEPSTTGLSPAYAQREFPMEGRTNKLIRVAGKAETTDQAIPINQDASVYVSKVLDGGEVRYDLPAGRGAWVHIVRGECSVNGTCLQSGDAAALETAGEIVVEGIAKTSELLLFDLA